MSENRHVRADLDGGQAQYDLIVLFDKTAQSAF